MGRNAAGEAFLRGFCKCQTAKDIFLYAAKESFFPEIKELSDQFGITDYAKFLSPMRHGALMEPGALFYPGPDIGHQAFLRSSFGHTSWSLCGITHTTSSTGAMDALCELITAPVQPWDAIICTSQAVKKNVEIVLQSQVDYLKDRLGITKLILPQLPVIPLGVHSSDFDFSEDQRTLSRLELGIADDAIVVLYLGRLSFHAKAHPFPMYRALEMAKSETQKDVVLVECGWYANDHIKKAFDEGASAICPSVRRIFLDGRSQNLRKQAWSCADVFCSLSDNIQETFGITPIEAMAAGLPVIVSDWDGYKDTVRDGIDGFRIPTCMPPPGLGGDLALRHALSIDSYDMYCGYSASFIAVDIETTAAAFKSLFNNPEFGKKMGSEGKKRAQTVYDWSSIIPLYEALWSQLSQLRNEVSQKSDARVPNVWPARLDPFTIFENYPSKTLSLELIVSLQKGDVERALRDLSATKDLTILNYTHAILPTHEEMQEIINVIAQRVSVSVEGVIAHFSQKRRPFIFRGLAWLFKMGIVKKV